MKPAFWISTTTSTGWPTTIGLFFFCMLRPLGY
jgi:hypothetical protein